MSAAALGGDPAASHCDAPADVEDVAAFDGMRLKHDLQRAIFEIGFERPTALQQRAIRPIASGSNVIAQTESQSGKSAMLSICAMQAVNTLCGDLQVIYLHTGRGEQDDTFVQVAQRLQSKLHGTGTDVADKNQAAAAAHLADMRLHRCLGSEATEHDVQCLSARAHIACGPPAAIADLIRRGHARTHAVRLLLLDQVHRYHI
jgi:ATP-dependent RNA helicase